MSRRDGTGPDGKGARTGRRMGPCNDNKDAGTSWGCRKGGRRKCGRACRWDASDNSVVTEN